MKGDIGFPDAPAPRDLERAARWPSEEAQAVYERSRFAQLAQAGAERGQNPDLSPFVGDDDHAEPYIDRGGRDTRDDWRQSPDVAEAFLAVANPKDAAALRDGKIPLDLLEPAALREVARAMHTGAVKYGRRNYVHPDTPIYATTYFAATMRHLLDYADGEEVAPDTGISHWAHIGANVNVVLAAMQAGTFIDDRAPGEPTAASAVSNAQHSVPIRSGD